MGRRERPVDPNAGAVQRFAYELRKLRREADGITYREMARRAHYSVTSLSQAAAGEQLPSLAVTLGYVGACGGDPAEWERRWRAVQGEVAVQVREDEDAEPPYQGLARFEPEDHERFFGRGELTSALRQSVAEHRFTAVFGPSGSGKSSLLRAGLIPALRRSGGSGDSKGSMDGRSSRDSGEDHGGSGLRLAAIRVLTPGEHPLATHADALRPLTDPPGKEGDTLVVVDQFEEVFTLCQDQAERAAFIDLLLTAHRPDSGLRVVIAVRADFYSRCAEHRGLARALRDTSVLVGPMSPAELREAVVKPAQAAGLIVERSLTARLVREVEGRPGGLPLLSHVLRETWHRRRGRALTEEAYQAAGGLDGAIAQTAEDIHTGLTPAQAELARLLMLRLIAPGEGSQDTRRPVPRAELDVAAPDDVQLVLDRLARARLLTLDDDTVCLAHEALITAWSRLGAWIDEDRERLRAHRRLTEAARAWDDLGRDLGALYRGARLAAAGEHFRGTSGRPAALTPVEDAFLTASLAGRVRERRRRHALVSALSCLLVLALVAGAVAWQQSRTSDRRRVEAEAGRLAAVAATLRLTDPAQAMRLSIAAWRLARTTETRSALLGSLGQKEQDVFTVPVPADADADADAPDTDTDTDADADAESADNHLSADGRTVVSIAPDRIDTWDVRTHRRIRTQPGVGRSPDDPAGEWMAVSQEGRTLALLDEGAVRLWDVRTARATGSLAVESPMDARFGPGGHVLVVDTWGAHVDDPMDLQVWDLRQRRRLLRLPLGKSEVVQDSAVSQDGRWLAVCTDERPLEIRNLGGGGRKLPLPWLDRAGKRDCFAGEFAFTPDSRRIALVTDTGIRIWDFRSGRALPPLKAEGVRDMRFSADGRFVVASTPDEILLWRVAAPGAPVFRYTLVNDTPYELRLDLAEGAVRYMSGSGATVRSLSLGSAVTDRWQNRETGGAKWSGDSRTLATVGRTDDRAGYELLDTHGSLVAKLPGEPCPPPEPDQESPGEQTPEDETLEEEAGTAVSRLEDAAVRLRNCSDTMTFSPDGGYFAYGQVQQDYDQSSAKRQLITVWDVRARRVLATVDLGRSGTSAPDGELPLGVSGIALGADGRTLAVSRVDEREVLELWDVRGGKRLRTLPGFAGEELAVRPDGGMIVSWRDSVADLSSGQVRQHGLSGDETTALAFSPDGAHLAAGDVQGRVTVWDGGLRERLGVLPATYSESRRAENEGVAALAFSPDGATLAVAGDLGTVQLWDTDSHRLLGSALSTPGDTIRSLAFGPDGGTLYGAGTHVPVQAYDIDPDRVAARLCARVGSGLSPADWRAYLPGIPYRATCASAG
ncbi:DNA-binding protein [Streptomyces europaeiscabiei]|uniref:nSTAND1 domain-containing NTPase n=1 Tax=Streptomyces europaeiscabiei TaxID=146819 RepID=UPI002E2B36BF|nr:DNA-binding protein [Streptomyces europaeiscabiei]